MWTQTHWDVTFFGSCSIDLEHLYKLFVHYLLLLLLLLLWLLSLLLLFVVVAAAVVVAVCKWRVVSLHTKFRPSIDECHCKKRISGAPRLQGAVVLLPWTSLCSYNVLCAPTSRQCCWLLSSIQCKMIRFYEGVLHWWGNLENYLPLGQVHLSSPNSSASDTIVLLSKTKVFESCGCTRSNTKFHVLPNRLNRPLKTAAVLKSVLFYDFVIS